MLEIEELLEAQAARALGRPAPARGDGTRDRPRAAGLPDGRAALEPRREAARSDARRDPPAPAPARHDHDLRDARPGRGDDDGRPHRGHERRPPPAGGTPQTLYDQPANEFVAGFIGSPSINLVEAQLERKNGELSVDFGNYRLAVDEQAARDRSALKDYVGRTVILGIQPEDFEDANRRIGRSERPAAKGRESSFHGAARRRSARLLRHLRHRHRFERELQRMSGEDADPSHVSARTATKRP